MGLGSILKGGLKWLGGLSGNPIVAGIGTGLELLGAGKSLLQGQGPGPYQQSYAQLKGAFRAADEAGLHRLAVAGSPAGYSPAPSSAAEGLLQAGAQLRAGPSAKEKELIDAQIEEARSRTALNNANARRAFLGPQPGLGGYSPRLADIVSAHRDRLGGPRGVRVEPEADVPMFGTSTIGDDTMVMPSEESFSVGIDELLAGALIYGPQWLAAQVRKFGEATREKGERMAEPRGRSEARRSASERERRAQQSPYLFGP